LAAIIFQHAILRPFVCDIGARITYFYGTGIRKISLNVLAERSFIFLAGSLERITFSQSKGASTNTRTYPVDCYQRILSVQLRALKRLDRSPRSWPAIVVPNNPAPPGHRYYVINGAVRRFAVRSDGRQQIVDLMLPRDFVVSDIQNEATIEAIAEETLLVRCPGQRAELLAQRDAGSRGSCGTSRPSPFLHHFCSSP
jgi:hypothetical protein